MQTIDSYVNQDKKGLRNSTIDIILPSDPNACITFREGGGYVDGADDACNALGWAPGHNLLSKFGTDRVDSAHGRIILSLPDYSEFEVGNIVAETIIHENLHQVLAMSLQSGGTIDTELLKEAEVEGEVKPAHHMFVTPMTSEIYRIWQALMDRGIVHQPITFNFDVARR